MKGIETIEIGSKDSKTFFQELLKLKPDLVIDMRPDPKHAQGAFNLNSLDKMSNKINADYFCIPELSYKESDEVHHCQDSEVGFGKAVHWILFARRKRIVLLSENKNHNIDVKEFLKRLLSASPVFWYDEGEFNWRMREEIQQAKLTKEAEEIMLNLLNQGILWTMLKNIDIV